MIIAESAANGFDRAKIICDQPFSGNIGRTCLFFFLLTDKDLPSFRISNRGLPIATSLSAVDLVQTPPAVQWLTTRENTNFVVDFFAQEAGVDVYEES